MIISFILGKIKFPMQVIIKRRGYQRSPSPYLVYQQNFATSFTNFGKLFQLTFTFTGKLSSFPFGILSFVVKRIIIVSLSPLHQPAALVFAPFRHSSVSTKLSASYIGSSYATSFILSSKIEFGFTL